MDVVDVGAVQHGHAARVEFEEVVDEGDDADDGGRRGGEGQAGHALDEGRDEGRGEMPVSWFQSSVGDETKSGREMDERGAHEDLKETEEARSVSDVHDVAVKEGVELREEVRVLTAVRKVSRVRRGFEVRVQRTDCASP